MLKNVGRQGRSFSFDLRPLGITRLFLSSGGDLMVLASKGSQKPRGTFFVIPDTTE
jgi:hypothetical protein